MERLGFHYFADQKHFTKRDLDKWLGKFVDSGASWIILDAPLEVAIPEYFIHSLVKADIKPILHIKPRPIDLFHTGQLDVLISSYAKWGVKHMIFGDRPNLQESWSASLWAKYDPVEKYLDYFVPFAHQLLSNQISPILSPLEPGGDYWDTAFLRNTLQELVKREEEKILANLIISCYASPGEKHLDWGIGGQERWPNSRPYSSKKQKGEDHFGFRIFDWYNTIAKAVLVKPLPIFLLGLHGSRFDDKPNSHLDIVRLLAGEQTNNASPLPEDVIGGAFLLPELAASISSDSKSSESNPNSSNAILKTIQEWLTEKDNSKSLQHSSAVISHYLLLPTYEWGIADWHLEIIKPFVKKYQPTIGFSIEEASHSQRVTILGSNQVFPESILRQLRNQGILVERIEGNGTEIATLLAKL